MRWRDLSKYARAKLKRFVRPQPEDPLAVVRECQREVEAGQKLERMTQMPGWSLYAAEIDRLYKECVDSFMAGDGKAEVMRQRASGILELKKWVEDEIERGRAALKRLEELDKERI